MYQGSCPAGMMCFDVPHKMSVSNLSHTINRSTFCMGWKAIGGKLDARVLLFRWTTLVGLPGLFLITVPRSGRQARLSGRNIHRGYGNESRPWQACHYRCSRCSWVSNDASDRIIIRLLPLHSSVASPSHHVSWSLRHLGTWSVTGPKQVALFLRVKWRMHWNIENKPRPVESTLWPIWALCNVENVFQYRLRND